MKPPHPTPAEWFEKEIRPNEGALRAYLRTLFPTLHDIDDIVQESYARVMRAQDAGKVRYARAFLFRTARNAALDICRRHQVVKFEGMADLDDLNVSSDSPDAADTLNTQQELSLLAEAVQSLPTRCREVMSVRFLHGMSQKEIAQKFGVAEHTVKNQLAKGMRRCAEFLETRGVRIQRNRGRSPQAPNSPA